MVIILITFIICVDHIPLLYYLFIIQYRNILVETNWTTKLVVRKSRDDISLDYTQETEVVAALPRNCSYFHKTYCLSEKFWWKSSLWSDRHYKFVAAVGLSDRHYSYFSETTQADSTPYCPTNAHNIKKHGIIKTF